MLMIETSNTMGVFGNLPWASAKCRWKSCFGLNTAFRRFRQFAVEYPPFCNKMSKSGHLDIAMSKLFSLYIYIIIIYIVQVGQIFNYPPPTTANCRKNTLWRPEPSVEKFFPKIVSAICRGFDFLALFFGQSLDIWTFILRVKNDEKRL